MPRVRITKAEKELKAEKSRCAMLCKNYAIDVSTMAFTLPAVKEHARAAHAALVDLSEAIQGIGVENTP